MKALRRSNTCSPSTSSPSPSSSWIHLRSLLIVSSSPVPVRGSLKSPWSRKKRKHALSSRQWNSLFSSDGKLRDGGVKFLKKARSGGIDPSIRAEVWPFLLGVYDLNSTEAERSSMKEQKRSEYETLRRRCRRLSHHDKMNGSKGVGEFSKKRNPSSSEAPEFPFPENFSARPSITFEEGSVIDDHPLFDKTPDSNPRDVKEGGSNRDQPVHNSEEDNSEITHVDAPVLDTESSDSESSVEGDDEYMPLPSISEEIVEPDPIYARITSRRGDFPEDFVTWQRIIRLDAVRTNAEWILHSPNQAAITEDEANQSAVAVGLKDYDYLEPCMIHHAARLVAVLEAYALYDPEVGYCQGMSDLLSPILAVVEEDHEAFWCFVGFMRKARHNFRLDEVGIRRQLGIVAKIIRFKDLHLYKHLENLQAEDCFFLYRMVVVLFRRELTFEQTLCLWEVMWADQAAIRAGTRRSSWGRIRLRAPPTDDLLLYAVAACVLQRRKLIIEKYSSMDEIIRECNDMAGQLDVWRLLDDAHDLVVTFHDRI